MKRISRAHTTCLFDPDQEPAAIASPGDMVLFETEDAQAGRVQDLDDALNIVLRINEANPVTGPLYIRGAQPGDTLAVRIVGIELASMGLGRVRPGRGVLGDRLRERAARLMPVREGVIHFNERIRFAARPMIGTIGTAPADESIPSYYPGAHGGNLDINAVFVGATVYLPVAVPGGLLSIGDVHASMGDGELTGGGVDIRASVTVQVDLLHGLGWSRPVVETSQAWCTCAAGPTCAAAIRLAADDMAHLLAQELALRFEESFILIGAAGDVRLGQAAQVGIDMTACVCINKEILPAIATNPSRWRRHDRANG